MVNAADDFNAIVLQRGELLDRLGRVDHCEVFFLRDDRNRFGY